MSMQKVDTAAVKKGMVLNIDNQLYKVVDTSHTHMGRQGATYTYKVKSLTTGKTNTFTYQGGSTLEQADVQTNMAVYLYNAGDTYSFMENDTGEMYEINVDMVDDIKDYLKENLDVYLMKYEGNIIGVILPNVIEYTITKTVPGVKGDRAQGGKKPATVETGLEVQVPLHKSEGDTISINTQTGEVS